MIEHLKKILEKLLSGYYGKYFKFFEKEIHLPGSHYIARSYKLFSATEKMIFAILSGIMVLTAFFMLFGVNNRFSVEIPKKGGALTEGIVGTPRFINPVLAITDADKDVTALVYAGLVKATAQGEYENLLAKSVDVSDDGKTYFVHLKEGLIFHDNKPLTADDVIYTIEKIKDPMIKSPKRANWEGVSIEKIDNLSINFHLKQPYAPFLENLTIGILPKHIWSKVVPDEFQWSSLNLEAIGAGPYIVNSVSRDSGGIPSEISLKAFNEYVKGEPFITNIKVLFYNNENKAVSSLISGEIDSLGGIAPENAETLSKRGFNIVSPTLPRIFALFFNQNHNKILADKNVRKALSLVAPREQIVSESLKNFGAPIYGPILNVSSKNIVSGDGLKEAGEILDKAGYKIASSTNGFRVKTTGKGKTAVSTPLKFSIATADTSDLVSAANILKNTYEKLGVEVSVEVFEAGDLQQNIIRERKYDSLLFGEVIGREMDLFPFWHSSERFDPGLNVALYANSKADKLLDSLRKIADNTKQQETLSLLIKEFDSDIPATFLYAPKYVYAISKRVKRVELKTVNNGSERFLDISDWFIETDSVWKIFVR